MIGLVLQDADPFKEGVKNQERENPNPTPHCRHSNQPNLQKIDGELTKSKKRATFKQEKGKIGVGRVAGRGLSKGVIFRETSALAMKRIENCWVGPKWTST